MLFADDVVLLSYSVIGLQRQLNVLRDAANELDLVVNLSKSSVIVCLGRVVILLYVKNVFSLKSYKMYSMHCNNRNNLVSSVCFVPLRVWLCLGKSRGG